MKTISKNAFQFMEPRQPLKLDDLQDGIRADARDLAPYLAQMEANNKTRDCVWAGQSPDGRKRRRFLGKEATPFENSSDAKVPASDEAINEIKLVMTAAQRAARLEVRGHNSNQDASSRLLTPVVNYVLGTLMQRDVQTQPKLWADIMLEHGHSFMHCGWLTRRELEERTVSVEDLLGMALELLTAEMQQESGGVVPDEATQMMLAQAEESALWDLILDENRRQELTSRLQAYDADMTAAEAGRVAAQLKRGESAVYFAPYARESRPFMEALTLGVDLVLSPSCGMDIQRAPRVTRWHWYSEAQLYDVATLEGWDDEQLDLVAKQPGPMWDDFTMLGMPQWAGGATQVGGAWSGQAAKEARLYHVAETWHRMPTKAGPSVLFRTIHHGACKKPLLHEVQKDKHGMIPIVPLQREVKSKLMLASRGLPQVAAGWQNSLKLHHDAQDDGTQLRTTPPMNVPQKRFKGLADGVNALPIGPWKQIPQPAGEKDVISFLEVPGSPVDSMNIQKQIREQMRRHFGLMDANVPAPVVQMHQQEMAAVFLHGMAQVIDLLVQLCQQYMDPIVGAQVAGLAVPLNATREQIQGRWQFTLSFDVKELDMEFLLKKFDLLAKMLQFDSGGAVPRGELMSYVFSAADPVLAARLKIDANGGSDTAYNDETSVIAAQVAGQRITGRLESPQSRLSAHWDWVKNPETMQMLQGRPTLIEVELMRAEALEQGIQQDENAQTGRTGEASEAPWEQGQKYSDWLKVTFGLVSPRQMAQGGEMQRAPEAMMAA